jgi:uncharacterized membrane protein
MFTLIISFFAFSVFERLTGRKVNFKPKPNYILAFILGILLWYGQLTTTSSNLVSFVTHLPNSFSTLLSSDSISNDIGKLQLQSSNVNTQQNLQNAYTQNQRQIQSFGNNQPIVSSKNYQPELNYSQGFIGFIKGPVSAFAGAALIIIYIGFAYGFEIIGMIPTNKKGSLNDALIALELFALSCIPLVAIILLVPSIAQDYNLSRAYMQLLMVFSPFAAIGFLRILSIFKIKKLEPIILSTFLSLFFIYTSGLAYLVFGGATYLTLDNYGYDYEKFYTTNSDILAARWLNDNDKRNVPVYADEYGQLKLQAYTDLARYRTSLFPSLIDKGSFVYLDRANLIDDTAFITYGNQEIEYKVPLSQLTTSENTIYNVNGDEVLL